MRLRGAIFICVVVGSLLAVAGVALAQNINCNKLVCYGTKRADSITAGDRGQTIIAGRGNDRVFALGGNDTVHGQGGDDTVSGGPGHDIIYGEAGNNTLSDTVGPANGSPEDVDIIYGGPGVDNIDVADGDDLDRICGGGGLDHERYDNGDKATDATTC